MSTAALRNGGHINWIYFQNALLIAGVAMLTFQSGLIQVWDHNEEYGHGLIILTLLGYMVYRQRHELPMAKSKRTGFVVPLCFLSFALWASGNLSGIDSLQLYGVWLVLVSITYAAGGWPLLRVLAIPLGIALMTFPLPNMLEVRLTTALQLLSSQIGAGLIRQFGGIVYLEGNVIDMGAVRLLVDEACSGLRYLYPLLSLGAIAGYLFRAPNWARWLLVASTIPITILMNSLRIATTGILVEHYGVEHTQGFLHLFEGWVVFLAAVIVLALFSGGLWWAVRGHGPLVQAFTLELRGIKPSGTPVGAVNEAHAASRQIPLLLVTLTVGIATATAALTANRPEGQLNRVLFSSFPPQLGHWVSQEYRLPLAIEEVAGASDYFYADFTAPSGQSINLYLSYYASQRGGRIPHSPEVCIPGDGWHVISLAPAWVADNRGFPFRLNRLVSSKGDRTILAYYWIRQGGESFYRESLARLDLVRLAIQENRTDGALVRVVAELKPGQSVAEVDGQMAELVAEVTAVLPNFVPN